VDDINSYFAQLASHTASTHSLVQHIEQNRLFNYR